MKRLLLVSGASLVVLVLFGLVFAVFYFGGPAYQGKRASWWLSRLDMAHGASREETRQAFHSMGPGAVPWLLEQLNSEDVAPWLRWEFDFKRRPGKRKILTTTAAIALGEVGAPAAAAIPSLVRFSRDQDPWFRSGAKAALIKIRQENLNSVEAELRTVQQTGKWDDLPELLVDLGSAAKPLVPILVSYLNSPSPAIQCTSADILGELRLSPEIAVTALAKNLTSKDNNVRFTAAMALNQYGAMARPASEALIAALDDKWDYVVHNALFAIEQFPESPEARNAVPVIRRLLSHRTGFIRKSAQRTLNKIQRTRSDG